MAITRDRFGNIISEVNRKSLLEVAQDAAGIAADMQVSAKDVNCIKKKLDDLALQAKDVANNQLGDIDA